MSKSKEQCLTIINNNFNPIKNVDNLITWVKALKDSILEISSSEYALLSAYDKNKQTLNMVLENFSQDTIALKESIVHSVLKSKKPFFDNYILSHKFYNQTIDNPLNIQIKSMMIVPIQSRGEVIGFISAFNSIQHPIEFKRYDIRSLLLLEPYARQTLEQPIDKPTTPSTPKVTSTQVKPKPKKESTPIKKKAVKSSPTLTSKKTKAILLAELDTQKATIKQLNNEIDTLKQNLTQQQKHQEDLEQTLHNRDESIEELTQTLKRYQQQLEESLEEKKELETIDKLNLILNFMTNELLFLKHREHKVFLLIEMIKGVMANKESLNDLESTLNESVFILDLLDKFYSVDYIKAEASTFNIFHLVESITNLYSTTLNEKNLNLNIFVDPTTPTLITLDKDKLQNVIVHLLNNIYALIEERGTIELSISSQNNHSTLKIEVLGLTPIKKVGTLQKFFKKNKVIHNLTTSDIGIGLGSCSHLIRLLNAKLQLHTQENSQPIFTVNIPMQIEDEVEKYFRPSQKRIAVVMSEENEHTYQNFKRYFNSYGINSSHITKVNSVKKLKRRAFDYLFCFEDLFSSQLNNSNQFKQVCLLKEQQDFNPPSKAHGETVSTLYTNQYYGLSLQELFFSENLREKPLLRTPLIEQNFFNKVNDIVKSKSYG
jgi:flagellar motor protein MotB